MSKPNLEVMKILKKIDLNTKIILKEKEAIIRINLPFKDWEFNTSFIQWITPQLNKLISFIREAITTNKGDLESAKDALFEIIDGSFKNIKILKNSNNEPLILDKLKRNEVVKREDRIIKLARESLDLLSQLRVK